jgi:hypothetical protein
MQGNATQPNGAIHMSTKSPARKKITEIVLTFLGLFIVILVWKQFNK